MTPSFGNWYSIQLSYERMFGNKLEHTDVKQLFFDCTTTPVERHEVHENNQEAIGKHGHGRTNATYTYKPRMTFGFGNRYSIQLSYERIV